MKLARLFLWITFLPLIMSSCNKDASYVSLPEFRKKLNINAFISPDQTDNYIFVSSNKARYGEQTTTDSIGNIRIFIYENSKEVSFTTRIETMEHFGKKFHIENFSFKEGQTYNIKIISDLGLQTEATCKVPLKRNFQITVDTSYKVTNDEYNRFSNLTVKVSVMDIPDEINYYRLLFIYETNKAEFKEFRHYSFANIIQSDIPWMTLFNSNLNDIMYSDVGLEGKEILLRTIEFQPVSLNFPHPEPTSALLRIYLLSTDKPYYDFHRSLLNYLEGESLFSEPSFLYSNIKGGTGIFASYVMDSLTYQIK